MGSLVDDLLQLARLDQGRPLDRAPVDLAALARDAALDAQAVAPDRADHRRGGRRRRSSSATRRSLRQVVANLVGNALVHAARRPDPPPGRRADGADAVLEVVDEGPGMAPADAAQAFERFYRADASRQRHSGGSGLGLAIVEATVRAHGGTVAIDTAPGAGTTVRARAPPGRRPGLGA